MSLRKKHNKKNADYTTLERQRRIAEMYCAGKSQHQIAKAEGISQPAVSQYLGKVRVQWMAEALVNYDERVAEELAKIDNMEVTAWAAWARSCEDAETQHRRVEKARRFVPTERPPEARGKKVGSNGKNAIKVEALIPVKTINDLKRTGQCGNEAFLARVAWCIETRLKMTTGLLQTKQENNTTIVVDWGQVSQRSPGGDKVMMQLEQAEQIPAPPPNTIPVQETNGKAHD